MVERPQQQIARGASRPDALRSFQRELTRVPQLQRTLGNRRVAQLIQAGRLTPDGEFIGLQRELTTDAAVDRNEPEAHRLTVAAMLVRRQGPSPKVILRKVRTSSSAGVDAFQALCPDAMFTSDPRGVISGQRCAGVNTPRETCKCLCQAVTNGRFYFIDVKTADWSGKGGLPIPSVWPNSGTNGSVWMITLPSGGGGQFGAFDSNGHCSPYPFERLLAHELCGHALGPPTGPQEPGNRKSHDSAIGIENEIAQEQGWPARGLFGDPNQGESYSQKSDDSKVVYKLKDGWHYEPCTPPPDPGPQHPRRRRRRRQRWLRRRKITNTENVRLVSDPVHWDVDEPPFLIERLPKGTMVKVLDKGSGEPFNQTVPEYQWWRVRTGGKEGWVMQALLEDVTRRPE